MKCAGVILAGGRSVRMGTDKGLMDFRGKPMVTFAIEALQACLDDCIIIANDLAYEQFNLPVFPDAIAGMGPLGGIYTGFLHSKTEHILVVSCDTPLIQTETLTELRDADPKHEIVVASCNNEIHPLIGRYSRSCSPSLKHQLEASLLRMTHFLEERHYSKIEFAKESESQFTNFNTPEIWKKWN